MPLHRLSPAGPYRTVPPTRPSRARIGIGALALSCIAASLTALTGAGAATVPGAAWPTALHDARHSATASVAGPQAGRILWSRQLGGNLTPGPVVGADGTIYVATNTGVLHAVDPATGADRWTLGGNGPFTGETDLSVSPLVLPSGSLLWSAPGHRLDEVSAGGVVTWSHTFTADVLSPVLAGTNVYLVTSDGTVSAIRLSGPQPTVAWSTSVGHHSFGSPVLDGAGQIVTTAGRAVVAVADHHTHGSIAWRRTLGATVEVSASTDARGDVFVTDNGGKGYSFTTSGALRWKKQLGQESYSSSSVSPEGLLYVGDNGGRLSIVRASTGAPVRHINTGAGLWAAQAIDQRGDVYVGTRSRSVEGFGPTGHVLFRIPLAGNVDGYPAITADGVLIVGDQSGVLYAIG